MSTPFVPEACVGCGDLHGHRAGDVEADEFIAGGRMRHINGVSVDFDCEGGRAHLRGNRRGVHMRSSMGKGRQSENGYKQRAQIRQREGPR